MKFTPNKPFETDQATVDVDPGLALGAYRFRLEVLDQNGRRSKPAEVVVTITERSITPPIVVDPRVVVPVVTGGGTPVLTPPAVTPRRPRRPTNPSPP